MNATMRSRLDHLLDADSFVLLFGSEDGEFIGGTGTIEGRTVCITAINPVATEKNDPFDVLQSELASFEYAKTNRILLIHLADRPGRIRMETTDIPVQILRTFIDLDGAGRTFSSLAQISGIVPRVAVVFSPIATTLTYPVAECDTVVMIEGSGMSLARPDMVRLMTGDASAYEDYGGARTHARISGTCDTMAATEEEALCWVRKYISLFPSWFGDLPPVISAHEPSRSNCSLPPLPADPDKVFDIVPFLQAIVDEGSLMEHRGEYAPEIATSFARIDGMACGVVANNSLYRGGILFPESCRKLAAFVSLCDSFNFPIIFLADIPGFMIGKYAEHAGIIHHGALVFSTLANIEVPHLCIVLRKAYTAGLYAMGGPGFDPDRFIALPNAKITIYGQRAVRMLALEAKMSTDDRRKVEEISDEISSITGYRDAGYLDAIIGPDEIRTSIREFLEKYYALPPKRPWPRRVLCL